MEDSSGAGAFLVLLSYTALIIIKLVCVCVCVCVCERVKLPGISGADFGGVSLADSKYKQKGKSVCSCHLKMSL